MSNDCHVCQRTGAPGRNEAVATQQLYWCDTQILSTPNTDDDFHKLSKTVQAPTREPMLQQPLPLASTTITRATTTTSRQRCARAVDKPTTLRPRAPKGRALRAGAQSQAAFTCTCTCACAVDHCVLGNLLSLNKIHRACASLRALALQAARPQRCDAASSRLPLVGPTVAQQPAADR